MHLLCQQKDTEDEVREIIRNNLHLQGKVRVLSMFCKCIWDKLMMMSLYYIYWIEKWKGFCSRSEWTHIWAHVLCLFMTVLCSWRTRLFAGRWLCTETSQTTMRTLLTQRRLWQESWTLLMSFSTWTRCVCCKVLETWRPGTELHPLTVLSGWVCVFRLNILSAVRRLCGTSCYPNRGREQ